MTRWIRPASTALLLGSLTLAGGNAWAQCRPLQPIGGSGEAVVLKRISADRLVGRTNWNTDFSVNSSYSSYHVTIQSASTAAGVFPVAAFLRFTDGSNLQLLRQNLNLAPQQQRRFGPFPSVPGKRTSQVNVRVGASDMPAATGFSYRVSAEGCR